MSKEEALPYYKWLVRDYRSNRKVGRMSWQAKGLYRELIDECWLEGAIPDDTAALADICNCPLEEFLKYWPEIRPCFVGSEVGLVNEKLDRQRTAKDLERIAKQKAGRLGGIAKMRRVTDEVSTEQNEQDNKQVLASAKQVLASASEPQADASNCHIAEQSREEEEQSSARDPDLPPSMVAQAVMHECGIAGRYVRDALEAVVRSAASKPAYSADSARAMLIQAWQDYEREKPYLRITWSAEKFFGDGHWRTPKAWPRKDDDGKRTTRLEEGDAEAVIELFGSGPPNQAGSGRGEALRERSRRL